MVSNGQGQGLYTSLLQESYVGETETCTKMCINDTEQTEHPNGIKTMRSVSPALHEQQR